MPEVVRKISTRLAIDGEAEYRDAITNINRELKNLDSALKLVESEYKNSANSMKALEEKQNALIALIDKQSAKVKESQSGLENARKAETQWAQQKAETAEKINMLGTALGLLDKSEASSVIAARKLEEELAALNKQQKDNEAGYNAASAGVIRWETDVNKAQISLNELNSDLKLNDKYLSEAKSSADGCATSIDQFGNAVKKSNDAAKANSEGITALASTLAASGLARTVKEIAAALNACVDASVEFESALAGVAKTTGLSGAPLAELGERIKEMSVNIPVSANEIAGLAESAAQLGIAQEDLLSFSEVMAMLGTATNLSANEAATALAKFASITQMNAADYERLGSVIVDLGNHFATTEADIVNMATNLAATGELVGLSEAEIMALATTLSSLGIEAAAGGTAMSKLLKQFEVMVATGSKDLDAFAEIAGLTAKEFTNIWKNSPTEALAKFIEGLGQIQNTGGSAVATLEELEIKEVRLSNAVLAMAASGDRLTNTLATANKAWEENNALANEAAMRFDTTESKMIMLSNSFDNLKVAVGDQLKPALNELVDAGRSVTEWATEFVEQHEWVGPVIAGVVAALGILIGSLTAYTVVLNILIPIMSAFNAALGPIGWLSIAVAGLTVAFTALGAAIPKSEIEQGAERVRELGKAVDETTQKYAEAKKEIEENGTNTTSLITRLDELAKTTNRTAGEEAVMAEIIERLNTAIPNLNLSYDELNGTLSITTEKLLDIARAERTRAEVDTAAKAAVDAEDKLEDVEAELEAERKLYLAAKGLYESAKNGVAGAVSSATLSNFKKSANTAEESVKSLEAQVDELNAVIEDNKAFIDEAIGATETFAEVEGEAEKAAKENAEEIEYLTGRFKEHQKAAEDLTATNDLLTKALTEQQEAGSLNIDTINDLIDAGYASALQIDKETGAVILDKDAYLVLAQAKIKEQTDSLAIDREKYIAAIVEEKNAALQRAGASAKVAVGYIDEAQALLMLNETEQGQLAAYDAQYAALEELKSELGQVTATAVSSSGTRKTAAEKAAEAEEKAAKEAAKAEEAAIKAQVDAYKNAREEIDHLRKMDLLGEDDYYRRLTEIRDEHLTGDADSVVSEYRKINEEIHKAQEDALTAQEKTYKEYLKTLQGDFEESVKEMQSLYDDLMKQQAQMEEKLKAFAADGLVEKIDTKQKDKDGKKIEKAVLSDLNKKLKELDTYNRVLTELSGRNVPTSLMNEVLGLSVEGAIEYGTLLLSQSEGQWKTYVGLYEQLQQRAEEISDKYFESDIEQAQADLEKLAKEFDERARSELAILEEAGFDSGGLFVDGISEGMRAKYDELLRECEVMANELTAKWREAWDEHSPSRVALELGENYIKGLEQGIEVEAAKLERVMARAIPNELTVPTQAQSAAMAAQDQTATLVNAFGTLAAGLRPGGEAIPVQISVKLESGVEVARAFISNIRDVDLQSPQFIPA